MRCREETQITRHICVEGWSAIGKWTGVRLSEFLRRVGADTRAKYVWFRCAEGYSTSIDMATALHPQTQMTFKFDGEILPRKYGFPMKVRMPTKLGFKNPKHVMEIAVINNWNPAATGRSRATTGSAGCRPGRCGSLRRQRGDEGQRLPFMSLIQPTITSVGSIVDQVRRSRRDPPWHRPCAAFASPFLLADDRHRHQTLDQRPAPQCVVGIAAGAATLNRSRASSNDTNASSNFLSANWLRPSLISASRQLVVPGRVLGVGGIEPALDRDAAVEHGQRLVVLVELEQHVREIGQDVRQEAPQRRIAAVPRDQVVRDLDRLAIAR